MVITKKSFNARLLYLNFKTDMIPREKLSRHKMKKTTYVMGLCFSSSVFSYL